MNEFDEQNDWARCCEGDGSAWKRFVERFAPVIHAACARTLSRHRAPLGVDPEDISQQIFLRLLRDDRRLLKRYDPARSRLSTWLTVIAQRLAIDALRKQAPALLAEGQAERQPAPAPAPPPQALDFGKASGLLSGRQKLVLSLLLEENRSVEEIARLLRVDPQTVRSTKHKAIEKLRAFYRSRP